MSLPAVEFDRLVANLVSYGFSIETAQQRIREEFGDAVEFKTTGRAQSALERDEQHAITAIFVRHGFKVRSTSQSRPSKVALGLPDLFVTHKTRPNLGFWFESKRAVGGILSEAQSDFAKDCERGGIPWYFGNRQAAAELMVTLGVEEIA